MRRPAAFLSLDYLQEIISEEKIQLAIANAENSAGGFGITPLIAEELFSLGVDVITIRQSHLGQERDLRLSAAHAALAAPGELSRGPAGKRLAGDQSAANGVPVAVIDLQGRVHLPAIEDPFRMADRF